MRLGILPLGPLPAVLAFDALADRLRAADVDVIALEDAPERGGGGVVREAERLARADCDGVLVPCPERLAARDLPVRCALALAGVPLLIAGTSSPGFFDAAGAAEAVGGGLMADRLPVLHDTLAERADAVLRWLRENERRERQRGLEAARELSRERLLVVGQIPDGIYFDPLQWLGQFGVTLSVVAIAEVAASSEGHSREAFREDIGRRSGDGITGLVLGADYPAGWHSVLTAPPVYAHDGDVDGALTHCLLRHLSADGQVGSVEVGATLISAPDRFPEDATFARLRRVAGSYACDLFAGHLNADREVRLGVDAGVLAGALGAGRLHYLTGRHAGAIRAACHALDVPVRRLDAVP